MDQTPEESLSPVSHFRPSHFQSELKLPACDGQLLKDAAIAIRQEWQDNSKWKRLRCRKVSVISERDRGTIYAIHVGSSVEFDWTWEGATAFRPHAIGEDGDGDIDLADFEESPVDEACLWSGEILEVDERNGCLYVCFSNPENPPTIGAFLVKPFDFLATLYNIYHEPRFEPIHEELTKRLSAASGEVFAQVACPTSVGLPNLREWWQQAWSILWGPPGTGKTYTTGQQIAEVLSDKNERFLVVSTTNRATDAVALSIGIAAQTKCPQSIEAGELLRIGKGASLQTFQSKSLEAMLQGTESEMLSDIDSLAQQLKFFEDWDEKALTRKQIAQLRMGGSDQSNRIFIDSSVRVVMATVFKAMRFIDTEVVRRMLERDEAPFTTIFIDEAGLISRAAIAALSLLASRRVVLVGDSKQLAPISRISRIVPTKQETWLAKSGLSHLDHFDRTQPNVHLLSEQRRMHPEVCEVISKYQYDGNLKTAPETATRPSRAPDLLANESRAIWYVLDDEAADLASIRAERGPGNRSWVREITPEILAKLFHDSGMRRSSGLFLSPFRAQSQAISKWFAAEKITTWESSTVHSQQGHEADIVIFDTVNAGSYGWPYDEWKRLINVGLSRAREAVIVLASRSKMREPYLNPLVDHLAPRILIRRDGKVQWVVAGASQQGTNPEQRSADNNLGNQFAKRKAMKPVLSQEQQRLSNLDLDGKPRLVRGVAGSGKTIVLSSWLAKTARRLAKDQDARIWAVYANRSLHRLLSESIEAAWKGSGSNDPFPWERVSLLHVKDVLQEILPSVSLSMSAFRFEYDRAAQEYLQRQNEATVVPRCRALFIDEAQDIGPNVLRVLLSLVEQSDKEDRNSRSAHIFFDNAQNVYKQKTPKWTEFGLDMRGRSTIMRESFRSTQPILEFSLNVLHRLSSIGDHPDHKELSSLGLIERAKRNGQEWLKVNFSQTHGPKPIVKRFSSRSEEFHALESHLKRLIQKEGVTPSDICLLYNGKLAPRLLETKLGPKLSKIGVELSVQVNRPFERKANTLVVTTPHSYKGYDSEIVLIPCADQFTTKEGEILFASLYVAMTRAKSILGVYSTDTDKSSVRNLNGVLNACHKAISEAPTIDSQECGPQADFDNLLEQIGGHHRKWLLSIRREYKLIQEPLMDSGGQVIAEPLFWFDKDGQRHACFLEAISNTTDRRLVDLDIVRIEVGQSLDDVR